MQEAQQPKRGNPEWRQGQSGNPSGRPRKTLDKEKKTNREIRSEELLSLTRKFRPHLSKAIKAAIDILDNKQATESGKLRASALIIQTYRELIKDTYDYKYDNEEADEIQQSAAPVFSLTMIGTDGRVEKAG